MSRVPLAVMPSSLFNGSGVLSPSPGLAVPLGATGLREARDGAGAAVLPGGRLTEEDAYAYAKFARVALGTNDIDYRARPSSDEELGFLGARVVFLRLAPGAL